MWSHDVNTGCFSFSGFSSRWMADDDISAEGRCALDCSLGAKIGSERDVGPERQDVGWLFQEHRVDFYERDINICILSTTPAGKPFILVSKIGVRFCRGSLRVTPVMAADLERCVSTCVCMGVCHLS